MRFGRAILDLRSGYVSGCGNAGRKDYLLHLLCPPPSPRCVPVRTLRGCRATLTAVWRRA